MKSRSREILLFVLDVLLNAAVIIVLVLILRFFVISPFRVSGPSMCDTFNNFDGVCVRGNGELIMIYKLGYENLLGWQIGLPDRGDVVIFSPPDAEEDEYYIKRVVGLPGETVKIIDGYVYIFNDEHPDGWALEESAYLNQVNLGHTDAPPDGSSVFEVPEDQYFVLGDNRKASSDSRRCFEATGCGGDYEDAYLSLEQIQGKAWLVFWPFTKMRVVDSPDY